MIATRRRRGRLWFDLDDGSAEITVYGGIVNIRISYHSDVAQLDTDDAVSMLRAMLREIVGPSIDDVREVWGDPRLWIRWWPNPQPDMSGATRDMCEIVDRLGRGILDGRQRFATEREALQAAYDAGVERAAAAVPPA